MQGPITLGWSHYLVLLAALCTVAVVMEIELEPHDGLSEAIFRAALHDYERDFGFETGLIRDWPHIRYGTVWGITHVTQGGRMDRAGVRSGDAPSGFHGAGPSSFHWAIKEALAGRAGCIEVINVEDVRAGRFGVRDVCLIGRDGRH